MKLSKIYVDGRDNVGWSIDSDRRNIEKALIRLSIPQSRRFYQADIIHNVWWNSLLSLDKFFFQFKKNILVTASNFIDPVGENFFLTKEFQKVKKIAKGWIAPSTIQKKKLENLGLRVYYQPFYLDLNLFSPTKKTVCQKELLHRFAIPFEKVKNRTIIGSFQRDSLGMDLTKPKWQKGPDFLITCLKDLPKDKYLLLLAGPRRHYVIKECRRLKIPYHFVGKETPNDDLHINSIQLKDMPFLYALTDIYLVTSKSEGGPKSVMEATSTKTFILSTDVGLASDFLPKEYIHASETSLKKQLFDLIGNLNYFEKIKQSIVEQNYLNCIGILRYNTMDQRLLRIYEDILK